MVKSKEEAKIHFDEVAFSFVFKGVADIVPEEVLAEKLEVLGFEINRGEKIFRLPVGEVVVINFAKKGGIDLLYDPRESSIGVGTKTGDIDILISHLDSLSNLLSDLEVDTPSFYRIIARGKAWYGKNVKNIIKDILEIKRENIEEILGIDVALQPMTLRLVPVERDFGEIPWIDIIIEPLVSNPRYWYIQFIYQDSDYTKSLEMLKELKARINNLLSYLEVVK